MFKIIIKEKYEDLGVEANLLIRDLLQKKEDAVIGLATGSSPLGLYKAMIDDCQNKLTSYQKVVTFNLDEYIGLPIEHPESYRSFMERNLFCGLDLDPDNIHLPFAKDAEDEEACLTYEELIRRYNIDLQVLGIGTNGHIGFNEPKTSFDSPTHIMELTKRTRLDNQRFFDSLDDVPTHAITMGIATIMKAKKHVLLANGVNKAQAIYDMINGPISDEVPASILQKHPDVVVILDKEAAGKL